MPIIKSAIKKVRKDKKRTKKNNLYIIAYKKAINNIKKKKGDLKKIINLAYSQIDKAVKRKVIHKNKGNRLKSQITKLIKIKKEKTAK